MEVTYIIRKKSVHFYSIERVFKLISGHLNYKLIELPYDSVGLLNRLGNLFFLWKKVFFSKKIYHITGHDHYLLWLPLPNCILTVHDTEALDRKAGLKKMIFQFLWYWLPMHNASRVTTISESTKTALQKIAKTRKEICVIENPISPEFSEQKTLVFNTAKPNILHIGVKSNKNLERLITALKVIPCHLTIIGKPEPRIIELLEQAGIHYSLKQNLSDALLVQCYDECDLLSFVSTQEGFGLPIIEAQAMKKPVITSNCSSMPEVAGEGALLVNPYDIKEIRRGILELINDEKLRIELVNKGMENVKRYSIDKVAAKYKMLYNEISHER